VVAGVGVHDGNRTRRAHLPNDRAAVRHSSAPAATLPRAVDPARVAAYLRRVADTALLSVLAGLRHAATSTEALVREAPEIIAWLGFDRVLLSRVQDGVWVPESMFVRRDPAWASAIMDAGRGTSTALRSVVEHDVMLTARPLVVDEVQTHPRVCRPIAVVSRSDNYGVAPIIVGGSMIGMLHADLFFQRRDVDDGQCVTLTAAAETLGAHLGRVTVLDQLRRIGSGDGQGWAAPAPRPDRHAPPDRLDRHARPGDPPVRLDPPARPAPSLASALTGREVEIVELMAAGATNRRIAGQLRITVGTARSHVSHILQKLNADNRAHAVAIWLQLSAGDPR
jgi:DNA-binding CsgD family transcriptional regulator